MDWLKCINSFHAVVQHKNFGKAAEQLRTTQPAVSKQVQWLEQQLGVHLLARTTREIGLTEVGQRFYAQTKDFLGQWQEIKTSVTGQAPTEFAGSLNVATSTTSGERVVWPLTVDFLQHHPQLQMNYEIHNHPIDLIRSDVDVYVTTLRMPVSKLVVREILAVLPWQLVVSPAYLKQKGQLKTLADLASHACLIYTLQIQPHVWSFNHGKTVEVDGHFYTNNIQSLILAALQGLGIALVPRLFVQKELAQKSLVTLFPEYTAQRDELYAYYQRSAKQSGLVMQYLAYLKSQLI